MKFTYKSDGTIACAGWFCCMIGSVIFGGVLLSYADIDDPWIFDECYIISRNDSCLDRKHDNCVVSVTALASTDPVWKEILLPTKFGSMIAY